MGEDEICSWHDPKRDINLTRHGYDFADLHAVFDGRFVMTRQDNRFDYGELRYNMLAEFRGRILNITFNPRAGKVHLISVRDANRKERAAYDARKPTP